MSETKHTRIAYWLSDRVVIGQGDEAESWPLNDPMALLAQLDDAVVTWVVAEYWVERHWVAVEGNPKSVAIERGHDVAWVQSEGRWHQVVAGLTVPGLQWLAPFLESPRTHAVIPEAEWVLAGEAPGVYAWIGAEGVAYAAHWHQSTVCALGAWRNPSLLGLEQWANREGVMVPEGYNDSLALKIPVCGESR